VRDITGHHYDAASLVIRTATRN